MFLNKMRFSEHQGPLARHEAPTFFLKQKKKKKNKIRENFFFHFVGKEQIGVKDKIFSHRLGRSNAARILR